MRIYVVKIFRSYSHVKGRCDCIKRASWVKTKILSMWIFSCYLEYNAKKMQIKRYPKLLWAKYKNKRDTRI